MRLSARRRDMTLPMMMTTRSAAMAAADWWAARLESGDADRFRAMLGELVATQLARQGAARLVVDFDPRGTLLTALRLSGILCAGSCYSAAGILPFHHSLLVFPDRLLMMEGLHRWTGVVAVGHRADAGRDARTHFGDPADPKPASPRALARARA